MKFFNKPVINLFSTGEIGLIKIDTNEASLFNILGTPIERLRKNKYEILRYRCFECVFVKNCLKLFIIDEFESIGYYYSNELLLNLIELYNLSKVDFVDVLDSQHIEW